MWSKVSISDLWFTSVSGAAVAGEDDALTERDEAAGEGKCGASPSALSAAVLRIGASLDLDTVLEEVVATARALTGAGCGAIATVDASGHPGDFVTSGLTADEHRALEAWPDGPGLFAHLAGLAAPLRLADLADLVNALIPSPCPIDCGAFQGTPMRHRGVHVGSFFLGTKAGGFTDADEEVLVLLAAQARGGGRQRTGAPRGAPRAGRPRSAGRDLPGRGGGARCGDRHVGLVQPRSQTHRRGAHLARASRRAARGRDDLPARRREYGDA